MKHLMAAALVCAATAYAGDGIFRINASQIVTGTMQPINWTAEANIRMIKTIGNYQYSTLSSVWQSQLPLLYLGGFNFYRPSWYAGPGWAPQLSSGGDVPYAAATAVPTVGGTQNNAQTSYSNPYVVRAAVDFPSPNGVSARVSNGSAYADFNSRISEVNDSGKTEDYFLAFATPVPTRTVTIPYSLSSSSDSNGGTYSYLNTGAVTSRSAVDVYVDGLPVYSDGSFFDHPATSTDAFTQLTTTFGTAAPATDPNVLIYLGKIPAGGSFTVDMVMRAEASANAPQCGTTYYSNLYPPQLVYNCLDLNKTIPIPAASGYISYRVFSLILN